MSRCYDTAAVLLGGIIGSKVVKDKTFHFTYTCICMTCADGLKSEISNKTDSPHGSHATFYRSSRSAR